MTSGEELVFLPLGGAGEIGMNLNLYGYGPPGKERWVMVDLGVTFGDGTVPGVDVIMPDPAFIAERRDSLDGLVLTHAHEDHLGAVPYLWERLECPIHATPFTAAFLREKLRETGFRDRVTIIEVPLGGRFQVGPFDMELITLTHSIPEPNAIAIRTPLGTVLHTGDWKFDPGPVVGPTSDMAALRSLGDAGVLAMVCDSTNVFEAGTSGSEAALLQSLTKIIGECKNRVAVACFASNVARLETIAAAAAANDRDVVIAGRSLRRIEATARATGYMGGVRAFLDEADAGFLPPDKTLIICTGSQGEARAALARIAAGTHPNVRLEAGDTVIFSSRVIPGNEVSIGQLQNDLVRRDIRIITGKDHFVHVSGHPARDELAEMYALARPRIAVPVHGELRHLAEHARLAKECQVPQSIVAENGSLVRLAPEAVEIIETVHADRLYLEGNRLVSRDSETVLGRTRALFNGTLVVTVVVDDDGLVDDPRITAIGLPEEAVASVRDAIISAVDDIPDKVWNDDKELSEIMRIAARRVVRRRFTKKPVTQVHLVRTQGVAAQ